MVQAFTLDEPSTERPHGNEFAVNRAMGDAGFAPLCQIPLDSLTRPLQVGECRQLAGRYNLADYSSRFRHMPCTS